MSARPIAAMSATDLLALGSVQPWVTRGRDVPGDLAIVGYNDIDFAEATAAPLSSVRQHPQHAVAMFLAEVLDEGTKVMHRHVTDKADDWFLGRLLA